MQELNGLDNGHFNNFSTYNKSSDSKDYLKRRPIKKVIKPVHHLKPLETPRSMKSPPLVQSTPIVPIKQPRLENSVSSSEYFHSTPINPKQEPADEEDFKEQSYNDHLDMSTILDTTLGEPSDSKSGLLGSQSKIQMDASSPGM